jgi:hypothetical protein
MTLLFNLFNTSLPQIRAGKARLVAHRADAWRTPPGW